MINKDTSLFCSPRLSTPVFTDKPSYTVFTQNPQTAPIDFTSIQQATPSLPFSPIVTEPVTPVITPSVLITASIPAKPLSEDNILSILDTFNDKAAVEEDYTNVAYQEMQRVLNKLPTVLSNQSNQQVRTFSSEIQNAPLKTPFQDASLFSLESNKEPIVQLANKKVEKTLERSIIDGDIPGAFAGPNKTYPITCAGDMKKMKKEAKVNNSASFKRAFERAMSIAKRFGWDEQEEFSEDVEVTTTVVKTSVNPNNVLCLSEDVKTDKQVSLTLLNDNVPDFLAFEDTENNKMMLKIPAGRLGKWVHPEYGDVEFTQEKFDQAIDNFNAGVVGYEPTLNVGHFVEVQSFGSAPTEGICCEVYQEADVLYADYECINPNVFNDVLAKRYRRSSSELVMDYVDRTNGRSVGMALVGMALTNRPFITDMPTVSVFSETTTPHLIDNKAITFAQFNLYENDNTNNDSVKLNNNNILDNKDLNNSDNMQTDKPTDTTVVTPVSVTTNNLSDDQIKSLSTEIQQVKVAFETAMEAQKTNFTSQLNEYAKEREALLSTNAALESRIAAMEAEKAAALLSEKVKTIKELDLTEDQKNQYIQMFTDKTFGSSENEDTVLNTLIKTFSQGKSFNKFTQQFGESVATVNNGEGTVVNPYTALIERNTSLNK
jgi:hypothetical protein